MTSHPAPSRLVRVAVAARRLTRDAAGRHDSQRGTRPLSRRPADQAPSRRPRPWGAARAVAAGIRPRCGGCLRGPARVAHASRGGRDRVALEVGKHRALEVVGEERRARAGAEAVRVAHPPPRLTDRRRRRFGFRVVCADVRDLAARPGSSRAVPLFAFRLQNGARRRARLP